MFHPVPVPDSIHCDPAVRVDVDVLNPIMKSVKQTTREIYLQLPPPVQQALPFVGVGFATGFIVYSIQARRLAHEVYIGSNILFGLGLAAHQPTCRHPPCTQASQALAYTTCQGKLLG